MNRHRVLIAFGIAWVSAALLSWAVYKRSSAPQMRDVTQVVAAAQDLPVGKRIMASDVKLVAIDRKDLPKGVFLKTAEVIDRAVTVPMTTNELLLTGKISAKGRGEGLTALIEPGTRAVSVQVNEISGVSGFIQPGTHVDVLFTRSFSNGDAATTTILQNVRVIAYGRQVDPAAKIDPRDTSKPTVATLLVLQDQAQRLVLAEQRGRIQLALRNSLDSEVSEWSDPVQSADLGIEEPVRPNAALLNPAPVVPPAKSDKPVDGHVVWIYRGDKLTQETIK